MTWDRNNQKFGVFEQLQNEFGKWCCFEGNRWSLIPPESSRNMVGRVWIKKVQSYHAIDLVEVQLTCLVLWSNVTRSFLVQTKMPLLQTGKKSWFIIEKTISLYYNLDKWWNCNILDPDSIVRYSTYIHNIQREKERERLPHAKTSSSFFLSIN